MTLRDDVHQYFEREAALYPTPRGLRQSVVAEAAQSGRDRPKTMHWAAAVAALLAVAVVATLLASGDLRRGIITPIAPLPTPSPRPAGLLPPGNVLDASLRDARSGWVLLERCSGSSCKYFVSSSDNGGAWSTPVQVGPAYSAGDGDAPRHVHILTASGDDGFVYGHAEAFVTHDGGRSWLDAGLKGSEIVAITGQGAAWAVTYPCAKGTPCAYQVQLSRDGGRTWVRTAPLPDGFQPQSMSNFAKGGLLISSFGVGDMVLTADGGGTWQPIGGNCRADALANQVATADGKELWQICTPTPPGVATTGVWFSGLYVSEDAGMTWAPRGPTLPGATLQTLATNAAGSLILATNSAGLLVTTDGARTWAQVRTNPQYLAMLSLSSLADGSAWALDARGTIWATASGGRTWQPVAASTG